MKQEIKLSGGLSITLDENQKKELLEQLNETSIDEVIKNDLLDMLEQNKSNVSFLNSDGSTSKHPNSRFEILNEEGEWLFDIDYDSKNPHFWYSYYRIYEFFTNKYSIKYDDIQEVMKSILVGHLNLKDVTPICQNQSLWIYW
jgi:hypothetical protein